MNPGKTTPPAPAPATQQALVRSLRAFAQMLPILLGMLLLTSLIFAWLPSSSLQTRPRPYAS